MITCWCYNTPIDRPNKSYPKTIHLEVQILKRRLIKTVLTCTVLGTSLFGVAPVLANDYDTQIEEAQRQAQENDQAASELDALVNQLSNEVANTETALNNLNGNIARNESALESALADLDSAHQEMNTLLEEISVLEKNIATRSVKLEEQARIVQVNGNPSNYFEFILNSDSLTDVIARIDVVTDLVSSSNKMIEDQKKDQTAVEEKSAETERKIAQQNALAGQLEQTTEDLRIQKASQVALVAQLEIEQNSAASDRAALIAERDSALQEVNNLETEREEVRVAVESAQRERAEQEAQAEEEAPQTTTVSVASSSQESNEREASRRETTQTNSNTQNNTANNVSEPAPEPETAASPQPESAPQSTPTQPTTPPSTPKPKPKPAPAPKPEPKPTPVASGNVLSIGAKYLGIPYLYGGNTTAGFDCSAFTQRVFAEAGKSLPRTAASQYASSTKVSNPQAGDLVFFSNGQNGYVDHVGIVVGNGQFLGAQTSTGVAYENLSNVYWGPRIVGYGRY